ncbi:MAG: PqqD family protein [Candidatus Coatesbacteria bacterium]|nr:PqqD family protein [Candidatus Coatesbacteria bacterium]
MTDNLPLRSKLVAYRNMQNEMVLVHKKTQMMLQLNKMGAYIWEQLDGKKTFNDIIVMIKNSFEVDENEDIEKDVTDFIKSLEENQMIDYVRV